MSKFHNINYLAKGSETQKLAFKTLTDNNIMAILKPYAPVLAGTIPIDIATETSDLDILCCFTSTDDFYNYLIHNFGKNENFKITISEINSEISVIATFKTTHFTIEIFGQSVPVINQFGYKHMIAEYNILKARGYTFRNEVIALKKAGYKTEPAFAQLLGLTGNPYLELLKYC